MACFRRIFGKIKSKEEAHIYTLIAAKYELAVPVLSDLLTRCDLAIFLYWLGEIVDNKHVYILSKFQSITVLFYRKMFRKKITKIHAVCGNV